MIICPNCKSENIDSANFCLLCGESLESVKHPPQEASDTKKCPYCGEEIKKVATVCRYCGRDLREEPAEEKTHKSINIYNPYLGCLGLLIIAAIIVLAITNPNKETHTNKIYSTIGEAAGQQLAGNTGSILGSLFGKAVGTVANWYDVSLFDYHDYIVFSTTTLNGQLITLGYFTNVKVVAPIEEWIPEFSSLVGIDFENYIEPLNQLSNTETEQQYNQKQEIEVFASGGWQDSGFWVNQGDTVSIQYVRGQWSPMKGLYHTDGQGCTDATICNQDPVFNSTYPDNVIGALHGILIARIGTNSAVVIGNGTIFKSNASGHLQMRMNDRVTWDNAGSIIVSVLINK